MLLLGLVLLAAFVASRSCASRDSDISQEKAVEIAIENAAFVPCAEERCRQARFIQRGIPPRAYWGVVLSEEINALGRPTRTQSFLVDAQSGAVSTP